MTRMAVSISKTTRKHGQISLSTRVFQAEELLKTFNGNQFVFRLAADGMAETGVHAHNAEYRGTAASTPELKCGWGLPC